MKIIPNVPVVYDGKFPKDFVNDVAGWGFTREELSKNIGKLLTLDIDFGDCCDLNCPHCFRRNNRVDLGKHKLMDFDKIVETIKQAKQLGLKSVKFLGAGEPFENERFLEFLRVLKQLDVIPVIFTKGHVIGDDGLVKKWHSKYGISTGKELIEELKKVNASILLGFNSFDTEVQDKMVGGIKGYTLKRNRALELLVNAGFNKTNPTKICLAALPITNDNYNDLFEIYNWARARNIYPIICPTMISGRCAPETAWQKITPATKKLADLYTRIYGYNIEKGIQTLELIESEGISPYAGGHPCNQIGSGMYITLTGTVLRCPGDDVTVLGNIWNGPLSGIWKKSENFKMSGTYNCGCPPKYGKSIPINLFKEVLKNLKSKKALK